MPTPQLVGEVGEHPALDFRQHIPHQAVRARALAITAFTNSTDPEMRRFGPSRRCLRPSGIPDKRRNGGKQWRRYIIGRARRGLGCCRDPIAPNRPEDGDRYHRRRAPVVPQRGEVRRGPRLRQVEGCCGVFQSPLPMTLRISEPSVTKSPQGAPPLRANLANDGALLAVEKLVPAREDPRVVSGLAATSEVVGRGFHPMIP
jgi:hypothetical protein